MIENFKIYIRKLQQLQRGDRQTSNEKIVSNKKRAHRKKLWAHAESVPLLSRYRVRNGTKAKDEIEVVMWWPHIHVMRVNDENDADVDDDDNNKIILSTSDCIWLKATEGNK